MSFIKGQLVLLPVVVLRVLNGSALSCAKKVALSSPNVRTQARGNQGVNMNQNVTSALAWSALIGPGTNSSSAALCKQWQVIGGLKLLVGRNVFVRLSSAICLAAADQEVPLADPKCGRMHRCSLGDNAATLVADGFIRFSNQLDSRAQLERREYVAPLNEEIQRAYARFIGHADKITDISKPRNTCGPPCREKFSRPSHQNRLVCENG